jgi:hypothetical protein
MTAIKFRIADAIQRSYAGGNKRINAENLRAIRYPNITVSGMPG